MHRIELHSHIPALFCIHRTQHIIIASKLNQIWHAFLGECCPSDSRKYVVAIQTGTVAIVPLNTVYTGKLISLRYRIDSVISVHGNTWGNGGSSSPEAMRSLSDPILEASRKYEKETDGFLLDLLNQHTHNNTFACELAHFQANRNRGKYACVAEIGIIIGSGVIEPACKTLVAHPERAMSEEVRARASQCCLSSWLVVGRWGGRRIGISMLRPGSCGLTCDGRGRGFAGGALFGCGWNLFGYQLLTQGFALPASSHWHLLRRICVDLGGAGVLCARTFGQLVGIGPAYKESC